MTAVVATTADLHSVMGILRSVTGEYGWNQGLHDNQAKLNFIKVLQSASNPEDPIRIADAIDLLVALNVAGEKSGKVALELSARVLPPDMLLSVKVLSTILSNMATNHPSSTDAHKKEVADDLASIQDLPDTQMTVGSFLQVLTSAFTEPPPVEEVSPEAYDGLTE